LIYTPEFQQLPEDAMKLVKDRLVADLSVSQRRTEREIIEETLPGFLVFND
jgi:hypothetical protein